MVGRGKLYHVTPLTKSGLHLQPAALEQSGFPEDFTLLPYRGWIFPKVPEDMRTGKQATVNWYPTETSQQAACDHCS